MSAPTPALPRSQPPPPGVLATWLDDFAWHRHSHGGAQFRWLEEDPLLIASTATRGRLSFTTTTDMRTLATGLTWIAERQEAIHAWCAATIRAASTATGGHQPLADLYGLPLQLIRLAAGGDSLTPAPAQSPPWVGRITRAVVLPNPITLGWEYLQLRNLWAASEAVLEDCLADLYLELTPTRPASALDEAAASPYPGALHDRVSAALNERGGPGSPARNYRQVLPRVHPPALGTSPARRGIAR